MRKTVPYRTAKRKPSPKPPKRVKRRNAKKGGSRFPERREPAYIAWLHGEKCVVTGLVAGFNRNVTQGEYWYANLFVLIVAAHNPSKGAGGWDKDALPLDDTLHKEQHRIGIKAFCAKYGIDWPKLAAEHYARFQAHQARGGA